MKIIILFLLCLFSSLALADQFQVSCLSASSVKVFPGQYNYECTAAAAPYPCCTASGKGTCPGTSSSIANRASMTLLNHGANDIFICKTNNCAACTTSAGFKLPQNIVFTDNISRGSLCCIASTANTTLSVLLP